MVVAGWVETKEPFANIYASNARRRDNTEAHGGQATPTIFCGKETPVIKSIARHDITDVVCSERKPLELQNH